MPPRVSRLLGLWNPLFFSRNLHNSRKWVKGSKNTCVSYTGQGTINRCHAPQYPIWVIKHGHVTLWLKVGNSLHVKYCYFLSCHISSHLFQCSILSRVLPWNIHVIKWDCLKARYSLFSDLMFVWRVTICLETKSFPFCPLMVYSFLTFVILACWTYIHWGVFRKNPYLFVSKLLL